MVFGLFAVAGAVFGAVLAGAVLPDAAGCVVAGVVVLLAAPFAAGDPVALTAPDVGVLVGAAAGSVVIGVGTGGNGFARMPAGCR